MCTSSWLTAVIGGMETHNTHTHTQQDMTVTPPEDIKLICNEADITDIQAIITGPAGTPYEGGNFRVKLKLGCEFPAVPPKATFITKIFHPNVSKIGEICVNTLKKDWSEQHGIKDILLVIKCLLIVPNPESALNEEAGRLLLERYEDYASHARLMTSIHAKPAAADADADADADNNSTAAVGDGTSTDTAAAKPAAATAAAAAKKKATVQKKRALKRL
jgi:ubiquitin-conjugating enzyme E2 S